MKVCLDIRSVTPRRTGVGNYVLSLLAAMGRVAPEQQISLLARLDNIKCLDSLPAGEMIHAAFVQESHPMGDVWEHLVLPRALNKRNIDVFHGPAMLVPYKAKAATVVTVHDLVPFTLAETIPGKYAAYMRWHLQKLAAGKARFIAPSRATAEDLREVLGLGQDRVTVIHEAARGEFRPIDDENTLQSARYRYGLDGPFVMFLGNIEPRKNLARLVPAFLKAADQVMPQCKLVITGQKAWLADKLLADIGSLAKDKRLVFTGYLPGEDLPVLLNLALAFAFPSLHEGFGLPALEALACGAPVLAGNAGALPEVVGDDAVLVDPLDIDDIAAGLARLMADEALRYDLAQAGPKHAAAFSWDEAARQTLAVYQRAAEENK